MSIDLQQFHQTFFDESFEGLDIMEANLLDLDIGSTDQDVINTIFRAAHSIKGGSGTFGFTEVAGFTHLLETLLDEMRDNKREVDQESIDCLLQSVDCVRSMLNATRDGEEILDQSVTENEKRLVAILGSSTQSSTDSKNQGVADQNVTEQPQSIGWTIEFKPHTGMLITGNDPLPMFSVLRDLGELSVEVDTSDLPDFDQLHPEDCHLSWKLKLTGNATKEQINDIFEWVEDDCDLKISALEDSAEISKATKVDVGPLKASVESSDEAPAPQDKKKTDDRRMQKSAGNETMSIRVGIDKVDDIINLVGELVITQSMLGQIGSEIEDVKECDNRRTERLREGLAQLERNTRELQESVMRVRMLPINFVFSRFPRMVHDLAQKMDKHIKLVITGEQTELDKTIMEKIGDPLVHLVRNSIDHGIETPEERIACGKSKTGTIWLSACHQGGNIVVEIRDDGKGLDRDRILSKAIERGLVNEGESLPDEKIYDLIFQPGFSTADIVSDVSGRGVGMDVVRRNIRDLGGSVEIKSEQGQGTRMLIRLPLTLAILDGQLVSVGPQTYIVPLTSIIESLQIRIAQVSTIAGQVQVYLLRDEYIPIIHLSDIFDIPTKNISIDGGLMVVVEGDGQKAGLIVNDLLAQQQVVIKSLETNYKPVMGLSGATILGDGTVALILDVAGLIQCAKSFDTSLLRSRRIDKPDEEIQIDPEHKMITTKMSKEMVDERDTIH
ncbi:MAG: chemotaxis protein CheA [Gammaproteobacteria bacterium]|nr:MAG: chemotaxis protein CheA [Gammaproteobacteria bacterium]